MSLRNDVRSIFEDAVGLVGDFLDIDPLKKIPKSARGSRQRHSSQGGSREGKYRRHENDLGLFSSSDDGYDSDEYAPEHNGSDDEICPGGEAHHRSPRSHEKQSTPSSSPWRERPMGSLQVPSGDRRTGHTRVSSEGQSGYTQDGRFHSPRLTPGERHARSRSSPDNTQSSFTTKRTHRSRSHGSGPRTLRHVPPGVDHPRTQQYSDRRSSSSTHPDTRSMCPPHTGREQYETQRLRTNVNSS